jgi:hypothetical protein
MGYGRGALAATGVGVVLFGHYYGQWALIGITVASVIAGALLVRATKRFRRDARS